MANLKISELDALTVLDGADVFAIVDVSAGQTKKVTLNTLIATVIAGAAEINNEVVAGSGTTFTLAQLPYGTTLKLYGMGQRLTLTTDYTVDSLTGIITLVNSWPTGAILADYVYTS